MNDSDNSDLGIETFEDVYNRKFSNGGDETVQENGVVYDSIKSGARHVARTSARIGETLVGLPGDLREVLSNIMIGIPEYAVGEELPRWRKMVQGNGGSFPTSKDVKQGLTKQATGDYLEPLNEYEEFADNIAQDFASLAIPIKGKIPFARALGSSIIANSGSEIVKPFIGDKGADLTKMGLLFTSGLIGQKGGGAKKYVSNLYEDMKQSVPSDASVSAAPLIKKLDKIESVLRKGDPSDASKVEAFKKIGAVRDKVKGGQISVDEVLELTKSSNEAIYGLGDLKRSQNQLYGIRNALHESAKEYGMQNKDFLGKWQSANEAFAATETSRKVGSWVKKNIKPKDYLYAAGALGLEASLGSIPAAGTTVGAGAALAATAYSAEVLKRMATSPSLRKHYFNVIGNSLNQNKAGFLRAMKQLDKGLEESFKEAPYETIEFSD